MQNNILKYVLDKIQAAIEAGETNLLLKSSSGPKNSGLCLQISKPEPDQNIYLITGFSMVREPIRTLAHGLAGLEGASAGKKTSGIRSDIPPLYYSASKKAFIPDFYKNITYRNAYRVTTYRLRNLATSWMNISLSDNEALEREEHDILSSISSLHVDMLNRLDELYLEYRHGYTPFCIISKSAYLNNANLVESIRQFTRGFHFSCADNLRKYVLLSVMAADVAVVYKSDAENLMELSKSIVNMTRMLREGFIALSPFDSYTVASLHPFDVGLKMKSDGSFPFGFTPFEMCKYLEDPHFLEDFNRDAMGWSGFMFTADICTLILQEVMQAEPSDLCKALYPKITDLSTGAEAALAYRKMVRGVMDCIYADAQTVRIKYLDDGEEKSASVYKCDLYRGILDAVDVLPSGGLTDTISPWFYPNDKFRISTKGKGVRYDEVISIKYNRTVLYQRDEN